jgi:hypothetical protein
VAAVQAMVSGGASLLLGRKTQTNLRALAVMNAMTMCAHQYEEYVDPSYLPGQVNVGVFKSDQPLNYPFNAHSAICANKAPTQLALFAWLGIGSTAPADNAEPDADSPALRFHCGRGSSNSTAGPSTRCSTVPRRVPSSANSIRSSSSPDCSGRFSSCG